MKRPHPLAQPHGPIREVLPDIWMVTGTVGMPGPVPMRFSRNMTVVRDGGRLVLVNSVRLGDEGLAQLDALGKVTDVIRLAANHGLDDPFYKERYSAKIWAVEGQRYTPGFSTSATKVYFEADVAMTKDTPLPLTGARLQVIGSTPPEALLVLERHNGTVIAGDCLQHWATTDSYFNWLGATMMKAMGFIKPYNVGPAWLRQTKPPKADMRAILDLSFANVMPAHGEAVIGDARNLYRPVIERVA